jgi:phosphoglycerate dehydrogenase-like enzyme
VLRRAQPFDVRPIYHDLRRLPAQEEERLGIEYRSLDNLLSEADIVTLHVFLSEGSRGLIGERELNLMKRTAILINTSRGDVVDEAALYRALKERRIAGAGIDVFEEEPTPSENPLLRLDNVLLTPHLAGGTLDSMRQKARAQYENFRRVVDGLPPINLTQPYHQVESGTKGRKT